MIMLRICQLMMKPDWGEKRMGQRNGRLALCQSYFFNSGRELLNFLESLPRSMSSNY